jgi:arylamine N-acetyltransferase
MSSAYSPEQVSTFLDYIEIPEHHRQKDGPKLDLEFLTDLHVHTLSTIPYENLSLHYNSEHTNTLDPEKLFEKIVTTNRGRGGYCMEISLLYNHILRALGFHVYTAGVKIRRREENGKPHGPYVGWVHIVNIVELPDGGGKYMCDVAFGGDGATKPLPLVEDEVTHNMGTQEVRLIKDHIPAQIDRRSHTKMWIYQYRNSSIQAWNSFYAFYEVEFSAEDYDVMNWYTGHSPESPQLGGVLVIKFLRRRRRRQEKKKKDGGEGEGEGENEIFGKRMLVQDTVKENLEWKTVVVETCVSEKDRVAALEKWFGIRLTEAEIKGIEGWKTELRG